ncbi:hypothetical protein L1987_66415 [Smallanthus sonchifolius]|uniref:Uncharacterized protein n=1 Tax=Smallanthus sonchifolius TaxID=185202 RepID=A0ACB9BX26_9ASTR|nr:hypothetical protein L1987_66415 [Smallanthus sonchifolius]
MSRPDVSAVGWGPIGASSCKPGTEISELGLKLKAPNGVGGVVLFSSKFRSTPSLSFQNTFQFNRFIPSH